MLQCITKSYKNDISHEEIAAFYSTYVKEDSVSFFLSWGWVDTWLKLVPSECELKFIVILQYDKPICSFFVGKKTIIRGKVFRINQVTLNVSGHKEYDNLWIEYNGIPSFLNTEICLNQLLDVVSFICDEFCLPGLDMRSFPGRSLQKLTPPYELIIEDNTISPYVDLDKIRKNKGDYLSFLSANTRAQIRRSFRELEKYGSVELEIAADLHHAYQIYEEMKGLHQVVWEKRGESGVFSSGLFDQFHTDLITSRFNKGEIQLLRVCAGDQTVGCLYSFVWKGHVYFYQCGFNYELGKKVKPGLVSHVLAVKYNADRGHDIYDFLAGNDRYKRDLSTDHNDMVWARIQSETLKLKVEKGFHTIINKVRKKGATS